MGTKKSIANKKNVSASAQSEPSASCGFALSLLAEIEQQLDQVFAVAAAAETHLRNREEMRRDAIAEDLFGAIRKRCENGEALFALREQLEILSAREESTSSPA